MNDCRFVKTPVFLLCGLFIISGVLFLSFEQVTLSLVGGGSFLHVAQHGFGCETLSFFSY